MALITVLKGPITNPDSGLGKLNKFHADLCVLKNQTDVKSRGEDSKKNLADLIELTKNLLDNNAMSHWGSTETKQKISDFFDNFSEGTSVPQCIDDLSTETAKLYCNFLESFDINNDLTRSAQWIVPKGMFGSIEDNRQFVIRATKQEIMLYELSLKQLLQSETQHYQELQLAENLCQAAYILITGTDLPSSDQQTTHPLISEEKQKEKYQFLFDTTEDLCKTLNQETILAQYYQRINSLIQPLIDEATSSYYLRCEEKIDHTSYTLLPMKANRTEGLVRNENLLLQSANDIPLHDKKNRRQQGFIGAAKRQFSAENYKKKINALQKAKIDITNQLEQYARPSKKASLSMFVDPTPNERKVELADALKAEINVILAGNQLDETTFYQDHLKKMLTHSIEAYQTNLGFVSNGLSFGKLGEILLKFRGELIDMVSEISDDCSPFTVYEHLTEEEKVSFGLTQVETGNSNAVTETDSKKRKLSI